VRPPSRTVRSVRRPGPGARRAGYPVVWGLPQD